MKQIYPDLWQTNLEMRFGTLISHAYLLERPEGNALFYTIDNQEELTEIAKAGGAVYQYLSHCHEVDASQAALRKALNCKLCCHALVAPYFGDSFAADIYFSNPDRETHSGNIEVIHTPGHTNNNVCYSYRSPTGKTYLFTGDVIYLDHGEWKTLIAESDGGNREEMVASLNLLRTLDVDVVICSVALGAMEVVEVTNPEWHTFIDHTLDGLSMS